jgi:endo-1,4-beta-xylanase
MRVRPLLVAVALVGGATSCRFVVEPSATSFAPASGARGPAAAVAATCADPQDCRLEELGEAVGVKVGMLVDPEDADEARIGAAELATVINHGISWNVVEKVRGTYRWGEPDARAAYARDNGLDQIAMHLYWDQVDVDDAPDWLASISDPDELRDVLRERARSVFSRYPDLYRIDVLNEPIETFGSAPYDNHFQRVLGPDYAVELFEIAASEAPPGTELIVNENLIEYLPAKADALVAFVERLVDAGVRIDAVGLQTHLLIGEPDWALFRTTMLRLEALGVKVFVSELDVPVAADVPDRAAVQAERYRRVAATCLSVAACDGLVVWGVSDHDSWLDWFLGPGFAPLLFDEFFRPKPAYESLREALAAGRTDGPPPFTTTTTTTTSPPATPSAADPGTRPTATPAIPVAATARFTG